MIVIVLIVALIALVLIGITLHNANPCTHCTSNQDCLTDADTKRRYCSKKGCTWKGVGYTPSKIGDVPICQNYTTQDEIFCDSKGSASQARRLALSLADDGKKCDLESCHNRLANDEGSYASAIGLCQAIDKCSKVLPHCSSVKKVPYPDHPERLCRDASGMYTGKVCRGSPCVDGKCN